MLVLAKPDGCIDIQMTNGFASNSTGVNIGITTCYIRIDNKTWIKSPFRSSFKTEEIARNCKTIKEFLTMI